VRGDGDDGETVHPSAGEHAEQHEVRHADGMRVARRTGEADDVGGRPAADATARSRRSAVRAATSPAAPSRAAQRGTVSSIWANSASAVAPPSRITLRPMRSFDWIAVVPRRSA
jgi:hypothetical protein